MKIAVSIAGLDPTAGAGILADQIVFAAHGFTFASAITCHVPQTSQKIAAIYTTKPKTLKQDLQSLDSMHGLRTIKIGAITNPDLFKPIAEFLKRHEDLPCVADPILNASDGTPFLPQESWDDYLLQIGSRATVITPNRDEAFRLAGLPSDAPIDKLWKWFRSTQLRAMLVKSIRETSDSIQDMLISQQSPEPITLSSTKFDMRIPHGSGCHLATSVAAHLGMGFGLYDAITRAKCWFSQALESTVEGAGGTRTFVLIPEIETDR